MHLREHSFLNFKFGFGCPFSVQVVFLFVHRVCGGVLQNVSRVGLHLSIFFNVFKRFVGCGFYSWCAGGFLRTFGFMVQFISAWYRGRGGVRESSWCVSRLRMFLPNVFSVF